MGKHSWKIGINMRVLKLELQKKLAFTEDFKEGLVAYSENDVHI